VSYSIWCCICYHVNSHLSIMGRKMNWYG
jgi:hypothetical protein